MALQPRDNWPPIDLAWRQKLAAYWSVCWPSLLVMFIVGVGLSSTWSLDQLSQHELLLSIASNSAFFVCQVLLVRRIVRKRFRTFEVRVLRDAEGDRPGLSGNEVAAIAVRLVWPQVAFLVAFSAVLWISQNANPEVIRLGSLGLWLRVLVVGPCATSYAIQANHPRFRLQAYGLRYV